MGYVHGATDIQNPMGELPQVDTSLITTLLQSMVICCMPLAVQSVHPRLKPTIKAIAFNKDPLAHQIPCIWQSMLLPHSKM